MKRFFPKFLVKASLCLAAVGFAGPALASTGTITPNPNPFDFGLVAVGDSVTQTFTLTRTNSSGIIQNIIIASTSLTNNDGYIITADTCTGATLTSIGALCTVDVTFNPGAEVASATTLTFVTTATNNNGILTAAITGTGDANPLVALNPTAFDFGQIALGETSAPVDFVLTNTGTTDLNVTSATITLNADFAAFNDTCSGVVVGVNQSCIVQVVFAPTVSGTATQGILAFVTDGGNTQATLDGEGIDGPNAIANPAALDFGQIGQGQSSGMLAVLLSNNGTSDLTILANPTISGSDASQFDIQNAGSACITGTLLAPGQSCIVQVVYSPDAIGLHSASLDFDTDANDPTVSLDGEGIDGPAVTLNPAGPIAFGSVAIGQFSLPQLVQVTNSGSDTLNVTSAVVADTADYTVTGNTCDGAAIAPGASCFVQLLCSPDSLGALPSTLDVTSDALSALDQVNLTCTGIQTAISVTGSGAFGNGVVGDLSGPHTITVTNNGDDDLTLGTIVQTGSDTQQFIISNNNCDSQVLAPTDSCTFDVSFFPVVGGALNSNILIPNNSATPSVNVGLTGTGILEGLGRLQIKSNVLDYDLEIGTSLTQSTTVTNIGNGDVTINTVTLDGDSNFTQTNDCDGVTLGAGDTCTITATFAAGNTAGNFSAVVSIDSTPGTNDFLALTGSALLDDDTPSSGGCSFQAAASGVSYAATWFLIVPVAAIGFIRRRSK